jgi:NAD(P)-dependent dehydrogenase (short-subunit alcohol dehydrogenase family)
MTGEATGGRLQGKVAIVTGASQGIGQGIALAFAREGATVIAAARTASKLEETVRAATGTIVPQVCDVTKEDDVRALVTAAEERFGALHVMVNNAGVAYTLPLIETSEAEWDTTMDTNVKGMFFGLKHAIPAMLRAGGGSIINIGSVTSVMAEKMSGAYAASKGAALMLTKAAACEHAAAGVRVNIICPGAVSTPLEDGYYEGLGDRDAAERWMASYQPLTGILLPDDVGKVAVFLASDESDSMTGASMLVDGGLTASWDHGPGPLEYSHPPARVRPAASAG